MSVKIIRGGIGSEMITMCIDEIRTSHEKNPDERCIMLVPDHYSFETEKRFVDEFGGIGLNNIDVMTPRKMAVTFLSAKNLNYLSESGRQMLISRSIMEYCADAENTPLIRTMKTAGFTDIMESMISELKRYCIVPEKLQSGADSTDNETLSEKLRAISSIYEKYNEFFEEGNYTDSSDDLLRVAEYIRSNSELDEKIHFWVGNFDEFLPQHMEILRAMADKNVDLTVCVNFPESDPTELYECLSDSYENIKSLSGYTGDIICDRTLTHVESEEIKFLLENFNNLSARWDKDVNDISVFAARDSYGEIEHTAGEILRLVREEGLRYRDIAVLCGNGDEVGHIIKAVFDEYEIPYFSDETITLSDHPIAMQLLSVFDIFDEDFGYNSVMRYLRAGFIYDGDYMHIDRSDIDKTEDFVIRYGIRGRKKWLDERWSVEKDSFERVWGDEEEEEDHDIEEEINLIKDRLISPVKELYSKVKKGKNGYDYAKAVFGYLESINMYGGLKKDVKRFEAESKTDEARQFSEIWNLILEVLDQTVVTMGKRKISFAEYGDYIRAGLSKCEIRTIPSRLDGVCVGSVQRSTAAPVSVLFVTGAVSGTYPSEISSEGFLSNADRSILREEYNITLAPDTKEQMRRQYFKVYKALVPIKSKLYLSYPVQNGEGNALRSARMVIDIQRMFPHLKVSDNIIGDSADKSYITSPQATLHRLLINKSRNGESVRSLEWDTVYKWFKNSDKYSAKLGLLEKATEFDGRRAALSEASAKALFGESITYSASRLNTYAKCPFSYFMKYGLGAKEQEDLEMTANEFGSYAHRFIQELCVRVEDGAQSPEEKSKRWKELSDSERNACVDSITNEAKEKIKEFNTHDEEKRLNMLDRISKTVKGSVAVVHKSLKKGKYVTDGFEREFDKIPIGDGIYIKGVVDRVDAYDDGDREYIRIIDYKTGNTGFDIVNIYNGIDMQMVIYAVAIKKAEMEAKHKNAEISGIFYNKVKNEFTNSQDTDSAKQEHIKNMRLDGVVFVPQNDDGSADMESLFAIDEDVRASAENSEGYESDFAPIKIFKNGNIGKSVRTEAECEGLMHKVVGNIKNIDNGIKSGNIEIHPYFENDRNNACQYCEFNEICSFEKENTDVRKKNIKTEEAWDKIMEEYREDGSDELDK